MIISRHWLQDYVPLNMPIEELTDRLTMSGLNLEEAKSVDGDMAIDLEVTSNRPDCLGHIGVAREVAVLFELPLTIPTAEPVVGGEHTADVTSVTNDCVDLCPQYIARVIRGVTIQPSPDWLVKRLNTVGIASINNVVDITNYVLLECGQPLHAFDFDKLNGRRIVVRRARKGEKLTAINQREYSLASDMCVIADADRPVALAGVMGGFDTEIGDRTTNVLIETAEFAPLSIRNTARALNLHSDSSYRFERGIDPLGLEWASRRCCQLILELAGGELLQEPVFAGRAPEPVRPEITLRFSQLPRVLGIDIPADKAVASLRSLGVEPTAAPTAESMTFRPPSWRRDLAREIDLVEEVARIYGYAHIPDDAPLPVVAAAKSLRDRVTGGIRSTLIAAGFYEAVTLSMVSDASCELFSPREKTERLRIEHSSFKQEDVLRQSLIPSLLQCRRTNERYGTPNAELFEIAKVYLSAQADRTAGNTEPTMIGIVGGRSFLELKGVVEAIAARLQPSAAIIARPSHVPQFTAGRGCELLLNGRTWGWLGELDRSVTDAIGLRDAVSVAELELSCLEDSAELIASFQPLPQYPAVERDLNFVLSEEVTWEQLSTTAKTAAGDLAETIAFGGQFRGPQIGSERKSYVVTITYRAADHTLTNDEVDAAQQRVIAACESHLAARLRS